MTRLQISPPQRDMNKWKNVAWYGNTMSLHTFSMPLQDHLGSRILKEAHLFLNCRHFMLNSVTSPTIQHEMPKAENIWGGKQ